jgi:selenocysteine lyase/cysteine desulfurase
VLGASTTQLFRNLSAAIKWQSGDELIVSSLDHEANIAPWVSVSERLGLKLKWWVPKDRLNPKLEASDLKSLMTEKTRLVTCTHASNILGTIHDIRAIAGVVHSVPGAMLCVDAVAYAPHRQLDVKELDVDFYAFSWYKVYGPHISLLYGSAKAQEQVGSLGHYFNPSATLEGKLGLAASSYEMTQAIPKVLDYFGSGGDAAATWNAMQRHEEQLAEFLLGYLRERKDVTIFGEPSADGEKRVPTISFVIEGQNSQDVVERVEKVSDFGFRWGAFYSNRLVENVLGLGKDGVIRVSMVHYNTGKWRFWYYVEWLGTG